MRRDDYIRIITSGLLTIPEDGFAGALAHFGQRFEMSELHKPGAVSLAGQHAFGDTMPFAEWLEGLRSEQVLRVSFSWSAAANDLPPAVAAAFAGGLLQLMHVSTANARRSYVLQTVRCPQYELTPEQFEKLIDQQEYAPALWRRIEELVSEGNALNNRRAFPAGSVAAYLQGNNGFAEGCDVFDFMASDLFREAQIESIVLGGTFILPDPMKALFYQSGFSFGDDDRDTAYLYPLRDVTPADLYALIAAQPFDAAVIWHRTAVSLQEYPPAGIPEPTAMGWEQTLHSLDAESFSRVVGAVCQAICRLCEENGGRPVIPQALASHFGPDALDAERARIRARINSNQWYLEGTRSPWELYVFAFAGEVSEEPEPSEKQSWLEAFRKALDAAQGFALQIGSPFAEAFRLGGFVLDADFPAAGGFDAVHEAAVRTALQNAGFSDNAQEIFLRSFWLGEELTLLQWSPGRIRGLIALDVTDVFGGMGSWNDVGPDGDNDTYQRITDELFRSRENFFSEILEG